MNKKYSFLLIMMLVVSPIFLFNNVEAKTTIEMTECEYTDNYEDWLKLSDSEKENSIEPAMCKNSDNFYNIKTGESTIGNASIDDNSFDLRDYGFDSGERSQQIAGPCWTFADLASVESNILVKGYELTDLSEAHLELATQNSLFTSLLPFNRKFASGGDFAQSIGYFFSRTGPVLEDEVPYSLVLNTKNGTSTATLNDISGFKPAFSVNDGASLSYDKGKCTDSAIESIKEYLISNGELSASMYYGSNFTDNKSYYYNSSSSSINHGVAIIGWNDEIKASKFKSSSGAVPSRNGAWIVKNSYGDSHYFYISYDDIIICSSSYGYYNVDKHVEDNTYVYDILGSDGNSYINSQNLDYFYTANVFEKLTDNTEELKKVTIATSYSSQKYDILYSSTGLLSDLKTIYSGESEKIGLTTINFSNIKITNDKFAIAVKYYAVDEKNKIPCYYKNDDNLLSVEAGKSFMSTDGVSWSNFASSSYGNYYASIKAYTDNIDEINNEFNAIFTYLDDTGVISIGSQSTSCSTSSSSCEITLPAINVASDYEVLGWYQDVDGKNKAGNVGDKYQISSNTTLYALAKKTTTTYTSKFEMTEGVKSISKSSASCNTTTGKCNIVLPTIETESSYEVLGWYTASTGGEKVGNAGEIYELSNNITLYSRAVIKQNLSGSDSDSSQQKLEVNFIIGSDIENIGENKLLCTPSNGLCEIILPTIKAKDGYKVLGWFEDIAGNNKIGNAGDKYQVSSNITLYALAKKVITTYTVNFKTTEGIKSISKMSIACETTGVSCEVVLPTIEVKSGYSAIGFYTAETAGEKVGNSGDKYIINNDMTLYPRTLAVSNEDKSISNDFELVVNKNPNNIDFKEDASNPTTSDNRNYAILTVLLILLVVSIYVYNKKLKNKNVF
jgi:C1A family cysteine protease